MKDYNQEYFIVNRKGVHYPLLDMQKGESSTIFFSPGAIPVTKPVRLKFAAGGPREPQMADFLSLPFPVFSCRIAALLQKLDLKGVQFVPVVIEGTGKEIHEGYAVIHVYNRIACADLEKSDYVPSAIGGRILTFNKLVLDNEAIDEVPLQDRLIFAVKEKPTNILWHRSVIDLLLEARPTGLAVYRLSKWDAATPFVEEFFSVLEG